MRVLYVTGLWDAPGRYRCVHAVLQLRRAGVVASCIDVGAPHLAATVAAHSIVVLFRTPWNALLAHVTEQARARGTTLLCDTDDLLFGGDAERLAPFFDGLSPAQQRAYRATFDGLERTLDACSGCIVSTPALADAVAARGLPAWTHPNLLHPTNEREARLVRRLRPSRPTIGYWSGSNTHDQDLAAVAAPLARVLDERPDVRLLVGGWVRLPASLRPFADRVDRQPWVDWRLLPWAMAPCRVTIAPTAVVNGYTDARSALKFFEPGACGIPTIATPTGEYRRVIRDGETGWLAASDDEWIERLHAALDPATSRRVGDAAAGAVAAAHTFGPHHGVLATLLRPLDGRSDGSAPRALPMPPAGRGGRVRARWRLLRGRPLDGPSQPPPELSPVTARGPRATGAPCATWRAAAGLDASADGVLEAVDADPQLVSGPLTLDAAAWRFLRVELDATLHETAALGQLFWRIDDGPFCETRSATWRVASGETSLLLDLHDAGWPRGVVTGLRLDPTDCPATIRRLAVDLVGDDGRACRLLDHHAITAPGSERAVTIVLPVYNAPTQTAECIDSVLRHATGDWRLVMVDDASPDARMAPMLEAYARRDERITLLRNPRNLGVTGTTNAGIRAAGERDVVTLNTDTVVGAGFLDGLRACAYADARTGIVAPLSNNATICSAPDFCRPNDIPEGHTIESWAALVRATSLRLRPTLPNAVGFCMYVRRAVLDRIGLLDEPRFGRGYGDDDDLCQRALAAGFDIRLADDVFVYHEGHASYGPEAERLTNAHRHLIEEVHPGYFARIAYFIETNPLHPIHDGMRRALRRRGGSDPALLVLLHASFDTPAGGTEHHARDLVAGLRLPRVVVAVPLGDTLHVSEVIDGDVDGAIRYRFPLARAAERFTISHHPLTSALREVIRRFGVAAAHLQHLLPFPLDVWRLLVELDVPFLVSSHDHYAVCPNLYLIDPRDGRRCCAGADGRPADPSPCVGAMMTIMDARVPHDVAGFVHRHHEEFGGMLAAAHAIVVPSRIVRDALVRTHGVDPSRVHVIPYGYPQPAPAPAGSREGPLRVALVGLVSHLVKGSARYRALLTAARALPIEWHVFGDHEGDGFGTALHALGLGTRLVLHGPYARGDVVALLRAHAIDVTAHLPLALETFSFTLSESLLAGVPAVVNEGCAMADRIRENGAGWVVPSVDDAAALLARLVARPPDLDRARERAAAYRHPTIAASVAGHRALLEPLVQRARPVTMPDVHDRRAMAAAADRTTAPPAVSDAPPPAVARGLAAWLPSALHERIRLRRLARRMMPLVRFRLGGDDERVVNGPHFESIGARAGIATFRAVDTDPYFVLGPVTVPTLTARVLHFRIRPQAQGYLLAQIYFTHDLDEPFSEAKSLQVPLAAGPDGWCDAVIRVDDSTRVAQWDAGDRLARLRFDPLNVAGVVDVQELWLCPPDGGT